MNCKRAFSLWIVFCLLAVFCMSPVVFAADEESFTLRVGYWPGYGMFKDENGAPYGYTRDYMEEIAQINHWNVKFIPCDWDEGLRLLAGGQLDTFGPLQKTPEREKWFDYPAMRMGDEYGALYVRGDNDTIFYHDPATLSGKTLAAMTDNYYLGDLERYCTENNIALQIRILNDADAFAQSLSDSGVDLQIAGSMLPPPNTKAVLRFGAQDFFYPTTKGNQFVLDGLNRALGTIQREKPYYNATLYNRYYMQSSNNVNAFTREEHDYLLSAPVIKIGFQPGHAPCEYYDKTTGDVQGITIDLLKTVSTFSGLKFEYVPTAGTIDALEKLRQGELDFFMGAVDNQAFKDTQRLTMTTPILRTNLAFISKKGVHVTPDTAVIALPRDWMGVQLQMRENYPQMRTLYYDSSEACFDALLDGEANLAVENTFAVDRALSPYKYRTLSVSNMSRGELKLCLGATETISPLLLSVMNKAIASIDRNTMNEAVYPYTLGVPYTPTVFEIISRNALPLFCVVFLLFGVFGFASLYSRKKLNRLAYYDALTGEMNLTKFRLEAQRLIGRTDKTFAVMMLDIDKFKSINDLYGYEVGDRVLVLVAKALRSCMPPDALLCRGAADKFDYLLPYRGEQQMEEQFGLIAARVNGFVTRELSTCKIVLSAGVCVVRPEDNNIIAVIDRANIAAKQVKNYHASSFAYYDQSMYDKINNARTIETEMSTALENEEFALYLQPKIDLISKNIVGAEALVRWMHPKKGMIPPSDFIPLFEENGFIVSLDYYMLTQVCRLFERWKREERSLFTISVNLSRRHLENPNTARLLYDIVNRYDVDPRLIEMELTESAFDNCNVPAITALFNKLHSYGFSVSVDDFGTGYSSLSLLKDLPIDVLKLDRSFFDWQDSTGEKMEMLLESVISLSHKLHIKTLSEGVETLRQVELLVRLGCDLVQGFYFARPMPVEQLESRLTAGIFFGEIVHAGGERQ